MTAEDRARYLQDALAIARGTKSGTFTETRRIRAFGKLFGEVLDALIWLEDVAASMPEVMYDQSGMHSAVMNAREKIAAAGAWTEAEEQQANLAREGEAELGPEEFAERDERRIELEDDASREEREADEIANEFMDVPVSQGPHGVFSTETDEDLPRGPIPPAHDAHRGDTP